MKSRYSVGVALSCLLLVSSVVVCGARDSHGFYGQLMPFFINAQQQEAAKPSHSSIAGNNDQIKKPKAADLILCELDGNKMAQMTLDILDAYAPTAKLDESAISVLEKFGLASAGKRSVASKVLPRATVWGQIAFAESCVRTLSYDELSANQSVARLFADNDPLRKMCLKAFELIKSGHRAYLSYFASSDEVTKMVFNSVYFGSSVLSPLNTSAVALAGREAVGWAFVAAKLAAISGFASCCGLSGYAAYSNVCAARVGKELSSGSLRNLWLSELSKVPVDSIKRFMQVTAYGHCPLAVATSPEKSTQAHDVFVRRFTEEKEYRDAIMAKFVPQYVGRDFVHDLSQSEQKAVTGTCAMAVTLENQVFSLQDAFNISRTMYQAGLPKSLATGMAVLSSYGLKAGQDIWLFFIAKHAVEKLELEKGIFANYQARLIGMAKIVRGLTMLADVARESGNESLQQLAGDIELFLDAATEGDLLALLDALSTGTFVGDPSFFSNHGRILATHKRMEKCKEWFVRPLLAAGKIETFVSAAEFYVAHKQAEKPVCFVELVNDAEPRLELERAWNVLIDEQHAVCIDHIMLGKNGTQNVIFSGPNGTGKSTNESAIAHAIFLGKFGIACASRAVMTPFEIFEVHRNELEDVAKGDSSFMAQKARFDTICAHIAGLAGQRMIIFMDEPLNGTVEAEAGRIIYEKCRELLAQQKQAICLIATHAQQPIYLEVDTNGAFANYYVEVIESAPGQFERTFKLRLGTPDRWFNDPEWRHRFVAWLSREREAQNVPVV